MSIFSAAGISGKPGILIILPVIGMINPAPAAISICRTVTTKSFGRPSNFGLSDSDFCVLAIHTGSLSKPRVEGGQADDVLRAAHQLQ